MNSKKQIAYLVPKTTTLKCDENMCFDFINKGNSFGIIRLVTLQKNGEIILQKAVDVLPGDTPEILQKRVMEQAEWILLPAATELVAKTITEDKEKAND